MSEQLLSIAAADKTHCFVCFEALAAHLKSEPLPRFVEAVDAVPLFVTWKKQGRLRGCIGNLQPQAFPHGLVHYAIEAGVKDSRFDPMDFEELTTCTVGVSLLVNFEPNLKWDEWEVGTHGIVIRFAVQGTHYKAVFLPEVAKDQGWTKKETIEALIRKSGFKGRIDAKLLESIKLERFVSSKIEATYVEWINARIETQMAVSNRLMSDW